MALTSILMKCFKAGSPAHNGHDPCQPGPSASFVPVGVDGIGFQNLLVVGAEVNLSLSPPFYMSCMVQSLLKLLFQLTGYRKGIYVLENSNRRVSKWGLPY